MRNGESEASQNVAVKDKDVVPAYMVMGKEILVLR